MRFLITGDRVGGPVEIEADDFRQAVASYREKHGQRALSLSAWCEDERHLHYPDGQWEPANDLLQEVNQKSMTAAELSEYVNIALKFSPSPYSVRVQAIRYGQSPVTLAMITAESRRRSRVMRECLRPGSPAGAELMTQTVTAAMDGYRAIDAWRHGVRPEGYAS